MHRSTAISLAREMMLELIKVGRFTKCDIDLLEKDYAHLVDALHKVEDKDQPGR